MPCNARAQSIAIGVALALHGGGAARPLAAPGAPLGFAAQAGDAGAVVFAVVALRAVRAQGVRAAVALVVVQAGPQRELARGTAPGQARREDEFVDAVAALLHILLQRAARQRARGALVHRHGVAVERERQQPAIAPFAPAAAGGELAVGQAAALAHGQLDAGGRTRHRAAHDEVDGDRRGAAKLGRAAAQYLHALQLARGHAAHLGEGKARIGRGPLAVDEELHPVARHAPGAGVHAAVGAVLTRVDAGQLADQLAHGEAAQGLDLLAVDDGFLRGGVALVFQHVAGRAHGDFAQLALGRAGRWRCRCRLLRQHGGRAGSAHRGGQQAGMGRYKTRHLLLF